MICGALIYYGKKNFSAQAVIECLTQPLLASFSV